MMGNYQTNATQSHVSHTTNTTTATNTSNNSSNQQDEEKIDLETFLELFSAIQKIRMKEEAKTITNNKLNIKTDFKIYVGIDFGTNGCGIAYAVKDGLIPAPSDDDTDDDSDNDNDQDDDIDILNDDDDDNYKIIPHKWDDLAYDPSKLNTCILLNDKNEFEKFGNYARIEFTISSKKNWKLFDNFKMSLYKNENDDNDDMDDGKDDQKDVGINNDNNNTKIQLKHQIKSYNGSVTASDIVFCAALKHLKEKALEYIKTVLNIANITIDDIQWILTIPTIWNNESKHLMRKWGIESGLINKDITNHLKIVLEPECASLQIQYEYRNNPQIKFNKNDVYILCDAGGGTVDIVSHEIYSSFGVNEIIPSCGGPFGSINIDKKMEKLFDELFGKNNMNKFRTIRPKQYVKLLEEIIASKRTFYQNGDNTKYHSITLNKTFYDDIKQQNKKMKKHIKSIKQIFGVKGTDIGIGNNEAMFKISTSGIDYFWLEIHINIWKKIFDDECLNNIIILIRRIISQHNSILKNTKYIFMAGGLSSSKYFQKRMKDSFKNISIIVPENPLLSVVCGSARYGLQTDFVHTRILKKTYALRITRTYKSLMFDHLLNDVCKYINNNDNDVDDSMEELIRNLIDMYKKDDQLKDSFSDNMNDAELKNALFNKIQLELDDDNLISKDWIDNNITFSLLTQELVCNKILSILAKKGDKIIINDKKKITRNYRRWSKDQTMSTIEIYCSDNINPQTIDDADLLCTANLKYPTIDDDDDDDNDDNDDDNDDDNLDVVFEMSFDDSLLIAYVYPKGKRDQRAELAMEYQTN